MKIRISALTDVGKERTGNEDAFVFCPDLSLRDWSQTDTDGYIPLGHYGCLSVVADGMGGANAGEVASKIAIESTKRCFGEANLAEIVPDEERMRQLMAETFACIDRDIMARVAEEPDTVGMGTTVVMLWITEERSLLAWCGDSRCYLFSPRKGLVRLSKDHSFVQSLIDSGEISQKQALTHPDSSIITRCLGDSDTPKQPEIKEISIAAGEMLLLCSDGLCGYLPDSRIEKAVFQTFTDTAKCRAALLDMAYAAGGQDNITIIAVSTIPNEAAAPHIGRHAYLKKRLLSMLFH